MVPVWVKEGVGVGVLVGEFVAVLLGVGVQARMTVVTALEAALFLGVPLSTAALLTRVMPQLPTVPVTVKTALAPAARLPKVQTTFCPTTAGEPLEEV